MLRKRKTVIKKTLLPNHPWTTLTWGTRAPRSCRRPPACCARPGPCRPSPATRTSSPFPYPTTHRIMGAVQKNFLSGHIPKAFGPLPPKKSNNENILNFFSCIQIYIFNMRRNNLVVKKRYWINNYNFLQALADPVQKCLENFFAYPCISKLSKHC